MRQCIRQLSGVFLFTDGQNNYKNSRPDFGEEHRHARLHVQQPKYHNKNAVSVWRRNQMYFATHITDKLPQ